MQEAPLFIGWPDLKYVSGKILVGGQGFQPFIDVGLVYRKGSIVIDGCEGNFFKQAFHDRIKPACADVLGAFVDGMGNFSKSSDGFVVEFQLHAFGCQQCLVLRDQAGFRAGQYLFKIFNRQGFQFDTDWKTPLQFRNKVGRF